MVVLHNNNRDMEATLNKVMVAAATSSSQATAVLHLRATDIHRAVDTTSNSRNSSITFSRNVRAAMRVV